MRQDIRADLRRNRQSQLTAAAGSDFFDLGQPARERRDRLLGVRQESVPGFRQADAATVADEQRLAELALEAVQASGQGRLGDAQSLGSTADVATPRDLEETLYLRQLHRGHDRRLLYLTRYSQ